MLNRQNKLWLEEKSKELPKKLGLKQKVGVKIKNIIGIK